MNVYQPQNGVPGMQANVQLPPGYVMAPSQQGLVGYQQPQMMQQMPVDQMYLGNLMAMQYAGQQQQQQSMMPGVAVPDYSQMGQAAPPASVPPMDMGQMAQAVQPVYMVPDMGHMAQPGVIGQLPPPAPVISQIPAPPPEMGHVPVAPQPAINPLPPINANQNMPNNSMYNAASNNAFYPNDGNNMHNTNSTMLNSGNTNYNQNSFNQNNNGFNQSNNGFNQSNNGFNYQNNNDFNQNNNGINQNNNMANQNNQGNNDMYTNNMYNNNANNKASFNQNNNQQTNNQRGQRNNNKNWQRGGGNVGDRKFQQNSRGNNQNQINQNSGMQHMGNRQIAGESLVSTEAPSDMLPGSEHQTDKQRRNYSAGNTQYNAQQNQGYPNRNTGAAYGNITYPISAANNIPQNTSNTWSNQHSNASNWSEQHTHQPTTTASAWSNQHSSKSAAQTTTWPKHDVPNANSRGASWSKPSSNAPNSTPSDKQWHKKPSEVSKPTTSKLPSQSSAISVSSTSSKWPPQVSTNITATTSKWSPKVSTDSTAATSKWPPKASATSTATSSKWSTQSPASSSFTTTTWSGSKSASTTLSTSSNWSNQHVSTYQNRQTLTSADSQHHASGRDIKPLPSLKSEPPITQHNATSKQHQSQHPLQQNEDTHMHDRSDSAAVPPWHQPTEYHLTPHSDVPDHSHPGGFPEVKQAHAKDIALSRVPNRAADFLPQHHGRPETRMPHPDLLHLQAQLQREANLSVILPAASDAGHHINRQLQDIHNEMVRNAPPRDNLHRDVQLPLHPLGAAHDIRQGQGPGEHLPLARSSASDLQSLDQLKKPHLDAGLHQRIPPSSEALPQQRAAEQLNPALLDQIRMDLALADAARAHLIEEDRRMLATAVLGRHHLPGMNPRMPLDLREANELRHLAGVLPPPPLHDPLADRNVALNVARERFLAGRGPPMDPLGLPLPGSSLDKALASLSAGHKQIEYEKLLFEETLARQAEEQRPRMDEDEQWHPRSYDRPSYAEKAPNADLYKADSHRYGDDERRFKSRSRSRSWSRAEGRVQSQSPIRFRTRSRSGDFQSRSTSPLNLTSSKDTVADHVPGGLIDQDMARDGRVDYNYDRALYPDRLSAAQSHYEKNRERPLEETRYKIDEEVAGSHQRDTELSPLRTVGWSKRHQSSSRHRSRSREKSLTKDRVSSSSHSRGERRQRSKDRSRSKDRHRSRRDHRSSSASRTSSSRRSGSTRDSTSDTRRRSHGESSSKSSTRLAVGSLASATSERMLKSLFSSIEGLKNVRMSTSRKGAVVTFETRAQAEECRRKYDKSMVDQSSISVEFD